MGRKDGKILTYIQGLPCLTRRLYKSLQVNKEPKNIR